MAHIYHNMTQDVLTAMPSYSEFQDMLRPLTDLLSNDFYREKGALQMNWDATKFGFGQADDPDGSSSQSHVEGHPDDAFDVDSFLEGGDMESNLYLWAGWFFPARRQLKWEDVEALFSNPADLHDIAVEFKAVLMLPAMPVYSPIALTSWVVVKDKQATKQQLQLMMYRRFPAQLYVNADLVQSLIDDARADGQGPGSKHYLALETTSAMPIQHRHCLSHLRARLENDKDVFLAMPAPLFQSLHGGALTDVLATTQTRSSLPKARERSTMSLEAGPATPATTGVRAVTDRDRIQPARSNLSLADDDGCDFIQVDTGRDVLDHILDEREIADSQMVVFRVVHAHPHRLKRPLKAEDDLRSQAGAFSNSETSYHDLDSVDAWAGSLKFSRLSKKGLAKTISPGCWRLTPRAEENCLEETLWLMTPVKFFSDESNKDALALTQLEVALRLESQGWQQAILSEEARRPYEAGSAKLWYRDNKGAFFQSYGQCLLIADKLFACGVRAIHHGQIESYYRCLLQAPDDIKKGIEPFRRASVYRALLQDKTTQPSGLFALGPPMNDDGELLQQPMEANRRGATLALPPPTVPAVETLAPVAQNGGPSNRGAFSESASGSARDSTRPPVSVDQDSRLRQPRQRQPAAAAVVEMEAESGHGEPIEPNARRPRRTERHTKSVRFGDWDIRYIESAPVNQYRAYCNGHGDEMCDGKCTKSMRVNQASTEEAVIRRLKAWLLEGLECPDRTTHMYYTAVPSEAAAGTDAELEARLPPSAA
ncbi:unnamed protein product [Symbiodinium necroappetens]|uniref:Uncharacterized protein n=1 Tax=Symbiodinium necroappetens TaxID=1628268 RepID=A0A812WDF7_9DINO|nr:unnamed protein product [Symbiodinium necroappetens]